MTEPIEPIRHKLAEAIPDPKDQATGDGAKPPGPHKDEMSDAQIKQHNAEVQPEIKETIVDIGRAHLLPGRGPQ